MNFRSVLSNTVFAAALCLYGAPVLSSKAQPGNGIPVHTVVTIEAHKGSNPPSIGQQDVLVTENKKERDPVTEWIPAQGDHADLEFFILIDDGANMTLGTELETLRKFILDQPPTTKIGLAYMQNGIARVAQNLTPDHGPRPRLCACPLGSGVSTAVPIFLSAIW